MLTLFSAFYDGNEKASTAERQRMPGMVEKHAFLRGSDVFVWTSPKTQAVIDVSAPASSEDFIKESKHQDIRASELIVFSASARL